MKKQTISCLRVTGMELLKGIKSMKFWLTTICFVLLTCIILTSLSVWFAEVVYAVIMLLQGVKLVLPSIGDGNPNYYLYRLIAEGNYIGFWLLLSIFKCFAGVFFSAMTLALSTFIKNKYILIAMPLTIFFSLDSFSGLWFDNGMIQPDWMNWRILFFSMMDKGVMTETSAVIRTMIYTIVAVLVFGWILIGRIRKVVENE